MSNYYSILADQTMVDYYSPHDPLVRTRPRFTVIQMFW